VDRGLAEVPPVLSVDDCEDDGRQGAGGGLWFVFSACRETRYGTVTLLYSLSTSSLPALAPEYPYPEGLIDCISSYLFLTQPPPVTQHPTEPAPSYLNVAPQNIVMGGDSAGGNYVLCLLTWLRDNKYALPAGATLLSPAAELTCSNPDFQLNRFDYLPWAPWTNVKVPDYAREGGTPAIGGATAGLDAVSVTAGSTEFSVGEAEPDEDQLHLYCKNHEIFTPYVSPLIYSNMEGFPPVLVQVGDAERIWGQGLGVALKLARTGGAHGVRFESYRNQVHVFQMFAPIRKNSLGFTAMIRLGQFIDTVISQPSSPQPSKDIPTEFIEVDIDGTVRTVGDAPFRTRMAAMCEKVRKHKGGRDPDKNNGAFTADKQVPRAAYIWEGVRLDWYEKAAGDDPNAKL